MCTALAPWQDYLSGIYGRLQRETGAKGYYIDEYGVGIGRVGECFSTLHGHPAHLEYALADESKMLRKIRAQLPDDAILYNEVHPADWQTNFLDGSFDYAVCGYHQAFNANAPDPNEAPPVPLRLGRFLFPDFKVIQLVYWATPQGTNEEAHEQVFFNGDGDFMQGEPGAWLPQTVETMRRCFAIEHAHLAAFTGDDCEPLVPTRVRGVFANRFASTSETVWTLYNANWRSVAGEVLAVPHVAHATYEDAWNGKTITPRIDRGMAYLTTSLRPHGAGCVVMKHGGPK